MIRLLAFDLDGTLVATEELKAESYARAAHELDVGIAEADVIEAYKDVVGLSRQAVATALMERFGLEEAARARLAKSGGGAPWQGYVGVRLDYYRAMIGDAETVRAHRYAHATELLGEARHYACKVALATTSGREDAHQVLGALGLRDAFDMIVTADDVRHTKPDPEAYQLILNAFGIAPSEGLAVEDSPAGIEAAQAAGLHCIAATTDFTRARVHEAVRNGLVAPDRVVDDPAQLPEAVEATLEQEKGRRAHS